MYKSITQAFNKSVATVAMLALVLGSSGFTFASVANAMETEKVTVTVNKFIDGVQATAVSANGEEFPMTAAWNAANVGTNSGPYSLGPLGLNSANPYEAVTDDMTVGANYTTSEMLDGAFVGASCTEGKPFSLVGYSWGDTLAAAQVATISLVAPSFTGLTTNKHVIVWNHKCSNTTEMVKVTVNKFIDGVQATAVSANNALFPLTASWNAANIGATSSSYTLGPVGLNSVNAYEAVTVDMTVGADYTTNEMLNGAVVGTTCTGTTTPFSLVGYSWGDTLAAAQVATISLGAPSFTGLTTNKHVIVWNHKCPSTDGSIGGDVVGGPHGVLAVTSIDAVDTTASADGTFASGWKYVFHITAPDNETNLSMKFANWINNTATGTIPVANNMRISSAQADNAGATVLLTAANTYSSPALHMTGDLDLLTPGNQVQVTVEVAIPVGTTNGSYTTSYGVQTLP